MNCNRRTAGYLPIEDYGIIGDMQTCALVGSDGSLDFMCWPNFDSPSIFCRLLDTDKGGHFEISPQKSPLTTRPITKQQYLPCTNILQTTWIDEDGVAKLTDFFPVPTSTHKDNKEGSAGNASFQSQSIVVRKLECVRGKSKLMVDICPAFNYGLDPHRTTINHYPLKVVRKNHTISFSTEETGLDVGVFMGGTSNQEEDQPVIAYFQNQRPGFLGSSMRGTLTLLEGQTVTFVLYQPVPGFYESISSSLHSLEAETTKFWTSWIRKCNYIGRFREHVERSLLILKLLTYKPTGAIIAAPTFALPEAIGGARNWDYRYSWVRDSSFTVYVFLKMGFIEEAEAYIKFIFDRISTWQVLGETRAEDGGLPIMFRISGECPTPEENLFHFQGYKGTGPVLIGNGAVSHTQLDIYGELMDSIYLYNKYGKPISYDQWLSVCRMIDFVCTVYRNPDMSIWEVRGRKEQFTFSKIMLWVAFERAIRLAEKRCLACPNRSQWLQIRDTIQLEVMVHGFNQKKNSFVQSYDSFDTLDSAVLIAPFVFLVAPNDPRFTGTLDEILKTPEEGGLTSAGLVFRYDHRKVDDGELSLLILVLSQAQDPTEGLRHVL